MSFISFLLVGLVFSFSQSAFSQTANIRQTKSAVSTFNCDQKNNLESIARATYFHENYGIYPKFLASGSGNLSDANKKLIEKAIRVGEKKSIDGNLLFSLSERLPFFFKYYLNKIQIDDLCKLLTKNADSDKSFIEFFTAVGEAVLRFNHDDLINSPFVSKLVLSDDHKQVKTFFTYFDPLAFTGIYRNASNTDKNNTFEIELTIKSYKDETYLSKLKKLTDSYSKLIDSEINKYLKTKGSSQSSVLNMFDLVESLENPQYPPIAAFDQALEDLIDYQSIVSPDLINNPLSTVVSIEDEIAKVYVPDPSSIKPEPKTKEFGDCEDRLLKRLYQAELLPFQRQLSKLDKQRIALRRQFLVNGFGPYFKLTYSRDINWEDVRWD